MPDLGDLHSTQDDPFIAWQGHERASEEVGVDPHVWDWGGPGQEPEPDPGPDWDPYVLPPHDPAARSSLPLILLAAVGIFLATRAGVL